MYNLGNIDSRSMYYIYLLDTNTITTIIDHHSMRRYMDFIKTLNSAIRMTKKKHGKSSGFYISSDERFYFVISKDKLPNPVLNYWNNKSYLIAEQKSIGYDLLNTLALLTITIIQPTISGSSSF